MPGSEFIEVHGADFGVDEGTCELSYGKLVGNRIAFVGARALEAKFNPNSCVYTPINRFIDAADSVENGFQSCKEVVPLGWKTQMGPGRGLNNFGSTCYLNSVLQCLAYTTPLLNIFLDKRWRRDCNKPGFCPFCQLSSVVTNIFTKSGTVLESGQKALPSFTPIRIIKNLRTIGKQFNNHQQQDAHEFLREFMVKFDESCIQTHKEIFHAFGNYYRVPQSGSSPKPVIASQQCQSKPLGLAFSIFGGYFQSQVKCTSCGFTSDIYEPYMDLSIEVFMTLKKSLKKFCSVETLDGQNAYRCCNCKKDSTSTKRISISKPSNVLTIHLKRFDSFGNKIKKSFNYPETIDLNPYITENALENLANHYSLYAILMHHGSTCHSGHYSCHVKCSNNIWLHADDQTVTPVGINSVLNNNSAYILFYSRIKAHLPDDYNPPVVTVGETCLAPKSDAYAASTLDQSSPSKNDPQRMFDDQNPPITHEMVPPIVTDHSLNGTLKKSAKGVFNILRNLFNNPNAKLESSLEKLAAPKDVHSERPRANERAPQNDKNAATDASGAHAKKSNSQAVLDLLFEKKRSEHDDTTFKYSHLYNTNVGSWIDTKHDENTKWVQNAKNMDTKGKTHLRALSEFRKNKLNALRRDEYDLEYEKGKTKQIKNKSMSKDLGNALYNNPFQKAADQRNNKTDLAKKKLDESSNILMRTKKKLTDHHSSKKI